MAHEPSAAEYRHRAGELRRLAAQLEATPLLQLRASAGEDTWMSPRADDCRRLLQTDEARVRHAVADLEQQAWWYERRAEALELSPPRTW